MKFLRPIVRLVLVAAAVAALPARAPVRAQAHADLEAGQDAILLEERLEIEIVSEHLAHVRYSNRTRALTGKGVEDYNVASIFYNPSIDIHDFRAAVINPQGKRSEMKKAQFFDGAAFASYEMYADSRHRSVSFAGLVPGSTIEYSYALDIADLIYIPDIFDLQESIPVRSKTLVVTVPPCCPVRFAVTGPVQDDREERDGRVIHRWAVHDVPALVREKGMPPSEDVVPQVRLYLKSFGFGETRIRADDWNGIAQWTRDLFKERDTPAEEVTVKARTLTAGLEDPQAKARRLYEFVQSQIEYVAIELGVGGWQPHDNGAVLKNRYGDCKDKANLLIAMLRAVGVKAYPVLILTRDSGLTNRDYPSSNFNHAIAALPLEDGYLFMDPTSVNTPFGDLPWVDQGANALVVRDDGSGDLIQTPVSPPERNRIQWVVAASLGPDGQLEGSYTIEAFGQDRTDFAGFVAGTKPSEREDALAEFMTRICPGAVLLGQDVIAPKDPADSLKLVIRFKVPRFVTRAGAVDVFSPHLVRFAWLSSLTAAPTRTWPVFLENLQAETSEARLLLPPGKHVRKIPDNRTVEGPGFRAATVYEMKNESGRDLVVVKRSLEFSKREIPASDYAALRQSLGSVLEDEARALTLQSGN